MLSQEIQFVKGVGPHLAKKLQKLGLHTVEDLLFYFPRSYDDRRCLPKTSHLVPDQHATVFVRIESLEEKQVSSKMMLLKGRVKDEGGWLTVIWFNQPYLKKQLKIGRHCVLKGKIERDPFTARLQMKVAETELIRENDRLSDYVGAVFPLYGLTYGVSQIQIRKIILSVIRESQLSIKDPLPPRFRMALNLIALNEAIKDLHLPRDAASYKLARTRLVFDDFFYYQLQLAKRQHTQKKDLTATPLYVTNALIEPYIESLPYILTNAQQTVIGDVLGDIKHRSPMNRLVQGDVGAGKTEVAIIALLAAVEAGKVGVFMAPTEILAIQHFIKLTQSMEPLGVSVHLLKGKLKKSKKDEVLEALVSVEKLIVVGTHALLEDNVKIPNLGLVVIDEQHRFGVIQRQKLQDKSVSPHCLFMTATPIPRSFMLTCFGDLDKSIIGELPPGRKPSVTQFVSTNDQSALLRFVAVQLKQGSQIYVVFPLVEESDKLDLISAEEGFESYQKQFPDYTVGLIHGKMKSDKKAEIMDLFKDKKIQILVATTVIEVGVDVPNATVMIINHAERFGLSQLHQLRGRVGRGQQASYCFLVAEPKTENSKKRIQSLISTNDGFKLAEIDLQIRGPGDMLGTKQAGLPDFRLANLIQDEDILGVARKSAFSVISQNPKLEGVEYIGIKKELEKRRAVSVGDHLN